jgi:phosphatidylglycerophosphate synthase
MQIGSAPAHGGGRLGRMTAAPALGAFALTLVLAASLATALGVAPLSTMALACVPMIVALVAFRATAQRRFGLANAVTLVRAGLAAALAAPLLPLLRVEPAWLLVLTAIGLIGLDGLDGWIARRRGEASSFGARFDMEADTLLLSVLALLVLASGRAGVWVLLAPALRPLFLLGGWVWPPLAVPLPPSARRKVCCVIPLLTLAIVLAPPANETVAVLLALAAVVVLAGSFAVDLRWLLAHGGGGSSR